MDGRTQPLICTDVAYPSLLGRFEKKCPKKSVTPFYSIFSHFGAWKWQKMANNGQKWSNFLQYSIILPTHHFKEALEKKKVKINSPPLQKA